MALLTHDQWSSMVAGKYVDVDGSYGGQCWDTFADYCISVLGVPPINTWGGKMSGWAYAIWDQYWNNGASEYFDLVQPNQPARKGDVAIWKVEPTFYPSSHIAVVEGDAGSNVYCMSQNSSPAQPWLPGYHTSATGPNMRQYLPKQGLAGYLRRKGIDSIVPLGSINNEGKPMKQEVEITAIQAESIVQATVSRLKADLFSKKDGAWQNTILGDQSAALARIETSLGTKLDKNDGHSLRLAIQASGAVDAESVAAAIKDAVGDELAEDVVRALAQALGQSVGAKLQPGAEFVTPSKEVTKEEAK